MDFPEKRRDVEEHRQDPSDRWRCRRLRGLPLRLCVFAASLCLMPSSALIAEEKPAPPVDAKPAESKPAEATPAEPKPAEGAPAETKPAEAKPAGNTPAGTTHVDTKPTEPPKPPTDEQIAQIRWEEFSADNTWVCPFAQDFSRNEEFPERKTDWEDFLAKFALWAPGHVFDNTEKVRNLISACALMDIGQGQFESELPLFVYQRLRREIPDAKLKDILAIMAFHPNEGSVIGTAPELDLDIGVGEDQIRERLQVFAVKMLGRMLGKLPWEPPAQP